MQNPSVWIFKLRQGVRFHNRPPVNGREMVAEDVKYSYESLKGKAQYSTRAALVKTITVLDKYTVRFDLAMPDPKFHLNIVDSLSPVIVPREAVEAPGGLAEHPIGTGAFMLKEFSPGDGALLVKNPDYYLKDKEGRPLPYVDAVRLYFTKDAATDTALFRSKQVDVMRVSTLDQLYALMRTVPDLTLYRVSSFGWGDYGMSMALDKAPFRDVRVRQALSMAINRDIVAEVINKGDAALYGPFPWALAGYTKRTDYSYANLGPNYQYNPKEAKRLLAAAGYPNGFDVELEWAEFQGWTYGEFAQLVARFFNDIGVRVKLKQLETSTWLSKVTGVQPFNQMLATASPIGAGPSFMDWVYLRYHGSFPRTMNREPIQDPKLDDLLTSWRTDPGDKRPQLQRAIWDHLRAERLPHHHHRAAALPDRPVLRARGGQPLLLVPGLLLVRGQDGVADRQGPRPQVRQVRAVGRPRGAHVHRAADLAGAPGAVAGLPADLLARARPARRRRHHAARPGGRAHPGSPEARARGAGPRPPLPGPVPHLDGGRGPG